MLNQVEYYAHPAVRRHVESFCKKAEYVVGYGESEVWRGNKKGFYTAPVKGLDRMFEYGLDILTCMYQHGQTLTLFDVEYYNPQYPGEAHLNPDRVYKLMEPVYRAIMTVYRRYDLPVMSVVSGQGYHFWTRIPHGRVHSAIEKIGIIEPSVARTYKRKKISQKAGLAFSGTGRLQMFLCGEILKEIGKQRKSGKKILPVYFSDINPPHSREAISFDLTTYADPIHMRDARVPFSCYQKHKVMVDKVGQENADKIPVRVLLPRKVPGHRELSLERCLQMRNHFRDASELAEKVGTKMPDASQAWDKILTAFHRSKFGAFYYHFDSGPRSPAKINKRQLPPCVRKALNPEQLLEPTQVQTVVRVLDSMGHHPRAIAELIYKAYRRTDFGKYDAQRRAYFWAEGYAALIHTGIDLKRDLTCLKHQQKDRCPKPMCGWDLKNYR
ncbi:MAG: hypothetical protein JKX97_01270 [Candidatus Lindowbacteria bacterium]|nr:hypothetical protein [Candidatus Lindowbacteria bacterium]